ARVLEAPGFQALGTTSSGFAFTLGRRDGGITLDEVCEHIAALDSATGLPVSADLENGYGAEPEAAALAISRAAEAGAVGGSIEDWEPSGLYERAHAVERVAAAERIRGGGAVTGGAAKAFADAATAIRDDGDFSALAARVPLDRWL